MNLDNLKDIMLELDIIDLVNFCGTNKFTNQICKKEDFWREYYQVHQVSGPPNYPSPLEFYSKNFIDQQLEGSTLPIIDIPNLENYFIQNLYPKLLEKNQKKHLNYPEKLYSPFELYEQTNQYYTGKTKVEAGLKYLLDTEFPGFFDQIYDLLEEDPNITLGETISWLYQELKNNVEEINDDEIFEEN